MITGFLPAALCPGRNYSDKRPLRLVFEDGPHVSGKPTEDALPTFRVLFSGLSQTREALVAHGYTRAS
jgi:hypothetical protein